MVELPVEMFDIIASFSGRNDLPRLGTVSRAWQFAIERLTMRAIRIRSTDLQVFSDLFVHRNRQAALKFIDFEVVLPAYSDRQCARFETDQDKQRNNEALTDAVHSLFSILHSWDEESGMPGSETASYQRPIVAGRICLILNAYSPSDVDRRQNIDVKLQSYLRKNPDDLFEHRYQRSFLRVSRCDELPAVSRIGAFQAMELCHTRGRCIEGASLAGVAAKLPNLENILWTVNDNEKIYETVRQQHRFGKMFFFLFGESFYRKKSKFNCRVDFAQSLATLSLQFLKIVRLTIFNKAPANQHFKLSSALLPSDPLTDHLSLALHALSLSPNLTHLTLAGNIVLSPCFFWPQGPTTTTTPFWPHLQKLDVRLNITTPTGNWLYMRDPEDDDDEEDEEDNDPLIVPDLLSMWQEYETGSMHSNDSEVPRMFRGYLQSHLDGSKPEHYFRKKVDAKQLNPMLVAMARATRHMPVIRSLALQIYSPSSSEVDVWFLARGERPDVSVQFYDDDAEGEEERMVARMKKRWLVIIGNESKWSVPEDLLEAWRYVGAEDDDDVLVKIRYLE